jgi:hypothetical protein
VVATVEKPLGVLLEEEEEVRLDGKSACKSCVVVASIVKGKE